MVMVVSQVHVYRQTREDAGRNSVGSLCRGAEGDPGCPVQQPETRLSRFQLVRVTKKYVSTNHLCFVRVVFATRSVRNVKPLWVRTRGERTGLPRPGACPWPRGAAERPRALTPWAGSALEPGLAASLTSPSAVLAPWLQGERKASQ
ncbi:hypothetical protein VULLAG_LOCUS14836 [Vulpes lagopus]